MAFCLNIFLDLFWGSLIRVNSILLLFFKLVPFLHYLNFSLIGCLRVVFNSYGFIAAVDTSRFERAEDGGRVSVIDVCWRCRRVLAGLNSSGGVIIVIMRAIRQKEAPIYRLY